MSSERRQTLKQRRESTDRLVRAHKAKHAQRLADGEDVHPGELASIAKLELQVANLEAFERLQKLTVPQRRQARRARTQAEAGRAEASGG